MYEAAIYAPNVLRYVTLILLLFVIVSLPKSIGEVHAPSRRGWLFIVALELTFIGEIGLVVDRLNHPLRLFGTPIIFASTLMLTIYCLDVLRRGR
jgi:hypothetical protein